MGFVGSKYLTHDFAEIAVLSFWKQWRWSSDISNGTFFFRRSLSGCDSSLKLGRNVASHHNEESLQILFVLWNRHVMDVMNLGRVRSDAIFGVNVAEEADLRLSDCALV